MDIEYFNRHSKKLEKEKVYGMKAVKWLYESTYGKSLSRVISHPFVSALYGAYQDHPISRRKIPQFVHDFDINLSEFAPQSGRTESDPYENFNQFFIRSFREGKREFVEDDSIMPSFCEARYFGYEKISPEVKVPVKGKYLNTQDLLGRKKWQNHFEGGSLLIARLCPVDYHRFHFPDQGELVDDYSVYGPLHSVNPLALKNKADIFLTNKREVSILNTKNFGLMAFIEVGATCVGKIVQTHSKRSFLRGEEKGYFLFGGSTVILLGERGAWKPEDEILDYTSRGIEVYSKLGFSIARRG